MKSQLKTINESQLKILFKKKEKKYDKCVKYKKTCFQGNTCIYFPKRKMCVVNLINRAFENVWLKSPHTVFSTTLKQCVMYIRFKCFL